MCCFPGAFAGRQDGWLAAEFRGVAHLIIYNGQHTFPAPEGYVFTGWTQLGDVISVVCRDGRWVEIETVL
jgi:hypothetical protein